MCGSDFEVMNPGKKLVAFDAQTNERLPQRVSTYAFEDKIDQTVNAVLLDPEDDRYSTWHEPLSKGETYPIRQIIVRMEDES